MAYGKCLRYQLCSLVWENRESLLSSEFIVWWLASSFWHYVYANKTDGRANRRTNRVTTYIAPPQHRRASRGKHRLIDFYVLTLLTSWDIGWEWPRTLHRVLASGHGYHLRSTSALRFSRLALSGDWRRNPRAHQARRRGVKFINQVRIDQRHRCRKRGWDQSAAAGPERPPADTM